MTPREQADEILAANTADALAYAILDAEGKSMAAHTARRRDDARHWKRVANLLRIAAGGRVNIHRVQR